MEKTEQGRKIDMEEDASNSSMENQLSIDRKTQHQKKYGKNEAILHKDNSLKRLDSSFNKHISLKEYKKSKLLAYWVNDFANYHDEERSFNPRKLKRYKRGDIIKANLGFNIGGEFGGLHYCVVINKTDNTSFDTLNIVPLSSLKPEKKYSDYVVKLGSELFELLDKRHSNNLVDVTQKLVELNNNTSLSTIGTLNRLKELNEQMQYLVKLDDEIQKMKAGSVALVPQITTISKQRIYNPRSKKDILSGIKLSNASMDLIDKKIIEIYTK